MTRTRPASSWPEGDAVVYCEGAFNTPYGKTAHGLVRRTRRYGVRAVIDRRHAGGDAGEILDGRPCGIPVVGDLEAALAAMPAGGAGARYFVVGLATDGGVLPPAARAAVAAAIACGLNVDSGLHDYLNDDPELVAAAADRGVVLRDVRQPPPRRELHFWSGKIAEVTALKVALLGTDSAVGKRTTGWLLADALEGAGYRTEFVGTGQTAWMQGVRYGLMLDSLVNDFVTGEIEHAVWLAWHEQQPAAIVVEGQGSLLHPAFPGGFEILAAARPEAIVLQHAPARRDYDGFPGWPLDPIERQIAALELVSGQPVVAITLNHEELTRTELEAAAEELRKRTGRPVCDPLREGCDAVVAALAPLFRRRETRS